MRFLKAFAVAAFFFALATSVEHSTGLKTGFSPLTDVEARGGRRGQRSGHHRARHRTAHRTARRRHHRHHDYYDGPHPAAVALVAGMIVRSRPRNCTTVITRDLTYYYCDGIYYRSYYEGTSVVYVVVDAP